MNAPYDGDRGRGAGGDRRDQYPPAPPGAQEPPQPGPYAPDPYLGDPYPAEPYPGQAPTDESAAQQGGFPQGGQSAYGQQQYGQPQGGPPVPPPPAPSYPQQQAWPPAPQPGSEDATQLIGSVSGFPDRTAPTPPQRDAFAHLYRDQQQPYEPQRPQGRQVPAPGQHATSPSMEHTQPMVPAVEPPAAEPLVEPEPAPAAPAAKGGKAAGLLKSSALMAAGTMASRLLGFVKQAMIVAALGAGVLGDTYTVANQLPAMIFFLTIGGGLNSVFIPQLVRSMKEDADGGDAYANRLLTVVGVILGGLTLLTVLGAEYLVPLMSSKFADSPDANSVTVAFVRYCMPTIFFMGIHVVMGQILNARGRFGAMMWTPVLNNVVVIATLGMFLWVYGTADSSGFGGHEITIPPEGIRLLGVGTLLGLVVQALAMIPYLKAAGFKIRPRFDWRGHGLGKAAKLAKWTVLFVLANQAGNLVVTQLATAAGVNSKQAGTGIIAYINAQLIWNMPQAILTVSIMAAMLPRLSRSAVDGDTSAVRDDISQGLRTSAVAIVPIAFAFLALGIPICTLLFGSGGVEGARFFGYALMGFSLGLIPFSVQYVVLRAFYAYEDTRTPFYNTVIVAAVNAAGSALSYFVLPARWVVVGMGVSYGLAYAVGVGVAWRRLRNRLGGDLDGARVVRTYARLIGACVPATLIGGAIAYGIGQVLGAGVFGSLAALIGGGVMLLGVFYIAAKRMRVEEVNAMVGMVRGRLGR
ncbi:murein biosynthesis integral membrane protein MurJ [Streptomyces mobaraensis]|uniref:Murein biosynthesis integral membrane protein MurJ n=1 Tax=Streptomyces mobaraensis TaxID=35621 RepID=A0A5N5WB25_STRMB|nr:murein biosynthesis integral membrane protein MurJ [Streptomyces mobaraensis]KAB7848443.1 murein biosynthesis integral membrane protein MurJ [Streptomyces mobaraensis]